MTRENQAHKALVKEHDRWIRHLRSAIEAGKKLKGRDRVKPVLDFRNGHLRVLRELERGASPEEALNHPFASTVDIPEDEPIGVLPQKIWTIIANAISAFSMCAMKDLEGGEHE